jgi:hypothetical protein
MFCRSEKNRGTERQRHRAINSKIRGSRDAEVGYKREGRRIAERRVCVVSESATNWTRLVNVAALLAIYCKVDGQEAHLRLWTFIPSAVHITLDDR